MTDDKRTYRDELADAGESILKAAKALREELETGLGGLLGDGKAEEKPAPWRTSTGHRRQLAGKALEALEAWLATEPRLLPAERSHLSVAQGVLGRYAEGGA